MHTDMLKKIMAEPLVKAGEQMYARLGAVTVKQDSDLDGDRGSVALERYCAEVTWRMIIYANREATEDERRHQLRELHPALASMLYGEIRVEVMEALAASHRLGLVLAGDQDERDDGLVLHTALRRILDMTQVEQL